MENHIPKIFDKSALWIDVDKEIDYITNAISQVVHHDLHRQGVVLGISGGIDSSVVLALCVRAVGVDRVVGFLLPEKESSHESADLAHELADCFGVQTIIEDITAALEGFGCYQRRNEAIQRIFPDFGPGWGVKIMLPNDLLKQGSLNVFQLVVTKPTGVEIRQRLTPRE